MWGVAHSPIPWPTRDRRVLLTASCSMARRQPRLGAAELSDERAFLQAFGLTQAYEESRSVRPAPLPSPHAVCGVLTLGLCAQATLPRTYAHLIPGIVSGAAGDDASGARGGVRFPGLHTLYDEKYVVFGRPIEYFSQSQWQSAFSMKGKPGPHPGGDVDDLLAIVRQSRAGNTAQSGSDTSNAGAGAGAGAGGSAPHGRGAGAAGPHGHRARPSAAAILKQRTRPVAAAVRYAVPRLGAAMLTLVLGSVVVQAPRRPRNLTTEDYKTLGLQVRLLWRRGVVVAVPVGASHRDCV